MAANFGSFMTGTFRLSSSDDGDESKLGFSDSPEPPILPSPPCVEVLSSEASSSVKYTKESLDLDGMTLLKGRVSTKEVFALSNSDLVPGKYEGGLKLWEGSLDLVKSLRSEVGNGDLVLKDKRVLEPNVPSKRSKTTPTQGVEPCQTLRIDPNYIKSLTARGELGYWRENARTPLPQTVLTLNCTELRRSMADTLKFSLWIAYCEYSSMCETDMKAEIEKFVPIVVDVCMTALYAKLRTVHIAYDIHKQRYCIAPSHCEETELPLPFAMAIGEIGAFETRCMAPNHLIVPTFPEGTENEGRAQSFYPVSAYLSYLCTLRELKIPLKSVEVNSKTGSPWWTFKLEVNYGTVDLACTLPPSLYTDLSVQLRMLFVAPNDKGQFDASQIVSLPEDVPLYARRAMELLRGFNYRVFLALCHCPQEWWSFS